VSTKVGENSKTPEEGLKNSDGGGSKIKESIAKVVQIVVGEVALYFFSKEIKNPSAKFPQRPRRQGSPQAKGAKYGGGPNLTTSRRVRVLYKKEERGKKLSGREKGGSRPTKKGTGQ